MQLEERELSTRAQAYRGDTASWRVEGILQTALNCVRPRRGWRLQSRVHWVCQAQVRALWPFVPVLDAEELLLFGMPTFCAPGFILYFSQIMPQGVGNGGPGKSWHPQDTREECVGVIRVRH